MKMVELMAEIVQETIRQNKPIAVVFDVIPQARIPHQRKVLKVDRLPVPLHLRNFSSAQVATLYGVHPRTVRKWAEKGRIKPYRPNSHVTYYKGSELFAMNRCLNFRPR